LICFRQVNRLARVAAEAGDGMNDFAGAKTMTSMVR
jgi:hypothetical protein